MAKNSEIQWTDDTWNPFLGCARMSPACKFCYMYRIETRWGRDPENVRKGKTTFSLPKKWKSGRLIFTCSMSDFFIDKADSWRDDAWEVIRDCPQHTFQILTKRPERIKDHLPDYFDEIADRVWIGTTVESQTFVNRIEYLLDLPCKTFVSFEPLLGSIEWDDNMSQLDWCIVGGESGNETGDYLYRPMEISWAEYLVEKANENNVPCFVKQMGTYLYHQLGMTDRHGSIMEEFPVKLRVREFPPNKHGKVNVYG